MNPFDFVKASGGLDSLMPIVIFAIWIAISFFSNEAKKKKKLEQQRQLERQRAAEAASAPESVEPAPEMRESSALEEQIRRELETVLGGQESHQSPETTTTPESDPEEERDYSLESREVEESSYESGPSLETTTPPAAAPAPITPLARGAYYIDTTTDQGITATAITDAPTDEIKVYSPTELVLSRNEIRNGFIWSEVLAPPKALREN